MNVLELFAGIGGMALGLERAGMKAVGFVEINPWCQRVLAHHWPEVPQHDDVRTAIEWWLGAPRPPVDVVAGGYPCQPESNAGKGLSTADARWLWPEMARVIHALQPRYVIGENVAGHRTRGLRFVLRDLERLGYTARAGVVEAREVGAPHLRRRIFTLAERTDLAYAHGQARRPEARHAVTGTGGATMGERAAQPGGRGLALADADRERLKERAEPNSEAVARIKAPQRDDVGGRGHTLADADQPPPHAFSTTSRSRPPASERGWWTTEPDVGRMAHGVPGRVDRLRGLGNAVVPQVAEHIGRILLSGAWRDA